MAEYIEREALLKRITAHIKQITPIEDSRDMFYHDSGWNGAITGAELEVMNVPAADVVEVVHGKWEIILDDFDCEFMRCSCCGEEFYNGDEDTIDRLHNYCPNCGAKMDGETHGH